MVIYILKFPSQPRTQSQQQTNSNTATYIPATVRFTPYRKAAVCQQTEEQVQLVRGNQGGLIQSAGNLKGK